MTTRDVGTVGKEQPPTKKDTQDSSKPVDSKVGRADRGARQLGDAV